MEMARFAEPVDVFALESWNGCEIYENEEYRIMDNGDIVEQGTHSALLARGGVYEALYHSQFSEE